MTITDVRARKVESATSTRLLGTASITIDDAFVIHDVKIINGDQGRFIAMPSRKMATGEYKDVAHPINAETRNYIQEAVLEAFDNLKD